MTPKVTCEEIAVILGVSESWVNRVLHNAIEKMRKEAERLNLNLEDIYEQHQLVEDIQECNNAP